MEDNVTAGPYRATLLVRIISLFHDRKHVHEHLTICGWGTIFNNLQKNNLDLEVLCSNLFWGDSLVFLKE